MTKPIPASAKESGNQKVAQGDAPKPREALSVLSAAVLSPQESAKKLVTLLDRNLVSLVHAPSPTELREQERLDVRRKMYEMRRTLAHEIA